MRRGNKAITADEQSCGGRRANGDSELECKSMYRDEIYSLHILLSRTQAGPGRAVKEQQEQKLPNHVQRINLISVEVLEVIFEDFLCENIMFKSRK